MKFSLELFPPKVTDGIEKIYDCLAGMSEVNPDFISVTYSAGEAKAGLTLEVCDYLQREYKIPAVAHLTCAGQSVQTIDTALATMQKTGVTSVLALRGDLTEEKKLTDFRYATDLMQKIKGLGGFTLYGACYPEGHVESKSFDDDIEVMKIKNDLGVQEFLSQLFLDNADFLNMRDKAVRRGVTAVLAAGIMPVTQAKRIVRMVQLSGAKIPENVAKMLAKYEGDDDSLCKAGLDYAVEQIRELGKEGLQSAHLYTMNDIATAKYIRSGISDLL